MDKKKVKKFFFITVLTISVTIFSLLIITFKINFNIIGDKDITLELNEKYKDDGVKAEACILNLCKDISKEVKITSDLNIEKIGEYKIKYELEYQHKKYKLEKKVKIVEKVAPRLSLTGNNEVIQCPNKKYIEEGYEAIDNYDGNITDKVKIIENDDKIIYEVSDTSGNKVVAERIIKNKDEYPPEIKLKGSYRISLNKGEEYHEQGYTVTDNCDENLEDKVKIISNLNTNNFGTYNIKYEVTDSNGNKSSVTRVIEIYDFNDKDKDSYTKTLTEYIKNRGYNISVGYYNLKNKYLYTYNKDAVYYGASLIKTVDALYIYNKASSGEIDLTQTKIYESRHIHKYSGEMSKKAIGTPVSLRDLVKYAITVSDNSAHDMLIEHIGFNNLKTYGNSLGAPNTLVGGDNYGKTTVNDQLAYWKEVYNTINNTIYGQELKTHFTNTYSNDLNFSGGPSFMHKYGDYGVYHHDVGISLIQNPYIIVVLTNEGQRNYRTIINDISKKIYNLNNL